MTSKPKNNYLTALVAKLKARCKQAPKEPLKLRLVLEYKKVAVSDTTTALAEYVEVGDVRLYTTGIVVLGDRAFGPKMAIEDFEFGAGFIATRAKKSRTLLITPPEGGEPLEFEQHRLDKRWSKLIPFQDPAAEVLVSLFGDQMASFLYFFVKVWRQCT